MLDCASASHQSCFDSKKKRPWAGRWIYTPPILYITKMKEYSTFEGVQNGKAGKRAAMRRRGPDASNSTSRGRPGQRQHQYMYYY